MKDPFSHPARDSRGSQREDVGEARGCGEVLQRAQDGIRAQGADHFAGDPDLHRGQGCRGRGGRREEGQGSGGARAQGRAIRGDGSRQFRFRHRQEHGRVPGPFQERRPQQESGRFGLESAQGLHHRSRESGQRISHFARGGSTRRPAKPSYRKWRTGSTRCFSRQSWTLPSANI